VNPFGPKIAADLRKRRPNPQTIWHIGADKAGLSKPFLSLIFALLSNCRKAERRCRAATLGDAPQAMMWPWQQGQTRAEPPGKPDRRYRSGR
jgi:hypothetical protein